ncbi:MAG: sugar phosphate isomerase/epimerase [Gammaproteobacteria bacterium]|nr:MAG: sugar phosphate isomerase/epimerase [Gammaproteobacteria bacterium]
MKLKKSLAIALVSSAAILASYTQAAAPTQPKLSVQLWSIKDDVNKDFEGTLKQLKAYGFQGVEFAGSFGKYADDAKGLKAFLDKTGLKASAAHVPFDKLSPENFDKTVAFYKAIDCNMLIIPFDKRANTAEGALEIAKELSAIEAKLAPLGIHTGYHNHKQEMLNTGDTTPWDVIAKNTPASVVLQQDVGWTEVAGKDPVDIIKHYPGRTITTHYKAAAPDEGNKEDPIIGKDTTDWKTLIVANRTIGGTLWLTVEQEVYPAGLTPMQSVEASLKGLQKQIADLDKKK